MNHRTSANRNGTTLVAALVCLVVVSTMMLSLVHSSLSARRQLRNEHQIEQVRWLLDAGLRKGIAELKRNPEYKGEAMVLTPTLKKFPQSSINIHVDRSTQTDAEPKQVKLRVDVRLASDTQSTPAMRRSDEISIRINP